MKPSHKKEAQAKTFLRVKARMDELHKLIREVPYVPIKKKIFVGHWRFFKVRDDILRSSIGDAVKLVVEKCNSWTLGQKKDPKSYEKFYGTVYCRYFGETTVSKQCLDPLNEREMEEWNIPNKPSFVRKWFDISEKTRSYGSKNVVVKRYFPKIPPHMIEFAYKPAYVTETRPKIGDYESELAKLYQYMDLHNGWQFLYNRHRDEYDMSIPKRKLLEKIKNREKEEEENDPV